ncbi:MAG: sigma-54-dependent Fis family transcriptional regulator [Candidatus Eisenbacteria bacterium]|nr:sigma-54-dependent Fis family transcriptional regulator [Candidatus Eisenbacteria bacterium]
MELSRTVRAGGARVLIVDDEEAIRDSIREYLSDEGVACETRGWGSEALAALSHEEFALVITDLRMPEMDGLELIRRGREMCPDTLFMVLTAFGTLETAIEALRVGAMDYLQKPIVLPDLLLRVRRTLENRDLFQENARLRRILRRDETSVGLVGDSHPMREIRDLVSRYGPMDRPVLITGESGTGKELVARALHQASEHRDGPFLPVNCAALPENLLESELFGYKKGAFTGADRDKEGLMILAGEGTLFLDEVGELSPSIQAKLLRAIESREVIPLGAKRAVRIDARLVAATNRHLEARLETGEFRDDLYYRLNVLSIQVPPLRERREDIPALALHFVSKHRMELRSPAFEIDRGAMELILHHPWRGNVRELENVIQRALILAQDRTLHPKDLPLDLHVGSGAKEPIGSMIEWFGQPLKEVVRGYERRLIQHVIDHFDGDKEEAARRLQISLASLYSKLKESEEH